MPPSPPPLPLAQTMPAMTARPQPPIATPSPKPPALGTLPLGPGKNAPAFAGAVPTSTPNARTVFAGPPAANARTVLAQPPQSYGTGPAGAMPTAQAPPAPGPRVRPVTAPPLPPRNGPPIIAIPDAQPPPYLASQTASRMIRPVDPWHVGLRVWMIVWGVGLLAVFCIPLTTSPLVFPWNTVLDGVGTERLPPLMLPAIGLLGVVLAIAPMPSAARGAIAASLGLAGICAPMALADMNSAIAWPRCRDGNQKVK